MNNTALRVCVAIPTFRRPQTLAVLLDALTRLTFAKAPIAFDTLVVDNDPTDSVHAIVEQKRPLFSGALHYARVTDPGLSAVRNYAMTFVDGAYDAVVMIDDDEAPLPSWLDEMLAAREATGADAVIGLIVPSYLVAAPRWISAGSFFYVPPYPNHAFIHHGTTANCLVMLKAVRALDLAFDLAMNQAGGEDELFFRQLVARGGRIAFAAHAIVMDFIPPSRLNARYILHRELRMGNTLAICDRKIHGTPRALAIRAAKGLARIFLGLISLAPRTLVAGKCGLVKALADVSRGAGMLLGVAGVTIHGYRRADRVSSTYVFVERDPRLHQVPT